MEANSTDIQERTYIDITGVPPTTDLFKITPKTSHMHGEDDLVNIRTAVQIVLGGALQIRSEVMAYLVDVVVQVERGRWRCRASNDNLEQLLTFATHTKE